MAAFTTFQPESLERYLIMFGRGTLADFEPVKGGIENSNYFLTLEKESEKTEYVLTIIEDMEFSEVPFFNKVLSHLSHYGLPVAAPQMTLDGMTSTIFCGKPTFLFKRLPGAHLSLIDEAHCYKLGAFMAHSHHALSEFKERRENPYHLDWMNATLAKVKDGLSAEDNTLLSGLIEGYAELIEEDLPRGLIHGDLFRDNALFFDDQLSGVIDFYHTCEDLLIQDIAIAINDWCLTQDGRIEPALKQALIAGYESMRGLTDGEKAALLPMQRASAARFALTRLLSGDPPLKDPAEMYALANQLSDDR